MGQVDSSESLETPEITEIMEDFIKVTKYLTKPKGSKLCLRKISLKN